MIICEGPDGAGKTSLVNDLMEEFHLPKMPRFATSTGGPKMNMSKLMFDDHVNRAGQPCSIYDRHTLISEYIYAPACGRPITPGHLWPAAREMRHRLAHDTLLILCLPPFEVVKQNIIRTEQLKGVAEHIGFIYEQYQILRITWPGYFVTWDYTGHAGISPADLSSAVALHISEWNRQNV